MSNLSVVITIEPDVAPSQPMNPRRPPPPIPVHANNNNATPLPSPITPITPAEESILSGFHFPSLFRIGNTNSPLEPQTDVLELEDEDAQCVICLNSYEEGERLRKLFCGHHFHIKVSLSLFTFLFFNLLPRGKETRLEFVQYEKKVVPYFVNRNACI